MKRLFLFLGVAIILPAFCGTAQAHGIAPANNTALVNVQVSLSGADVPTTFTAALDGAQENPAVTTPGKGTGVFVLDSRGLSYRITIDGLSGPMTAAHFHNAAAGTNGGVVQPIPFDGATARGTWELTPAMRTELAAGRIYVNVHTAANSGGEIRGQVTPVSGTVSWAEVDWGQEFVGPATATPPAGSTAPTVDRVGFPEGYKTWHVLHEFDRVDNRQRRTVYANDKAASAKPGEPFPHGSVLVLETQGTLLDPLGNVRRDAGGRFIPSTAAPSIFVMRKEQGFGVDYKDIRNGEWEYAQYRADKSRVAPNSTTGGTQSCATCHIAAGPVKDWVFRNGQDFSRKARGTAVFWMDGSNLRYRATVSGLSGPLTAAHFHNAANNANGAVVQALTLDGNTASGSWAIPPAMVTELKSGRLYVNFHTAASPAGEVRGQIVPVSVLGGLEVAFTRTVSGRAWDFAWKGVTDDQGRVTVGIDTKDQTASGYYRARMVNTKTRSTVSDWASIPVRGGRRIDLQLEINGQAAIVGPFFGTPLQSATKPLVGSPAITILSGVEPLSPTLSFGIAEKREDGSLDLPVQVSDARDLFGGSLTLTYDPALLSFRAARIGNTDLTVLESGGGSLSLNFEGLVPADQTGLILSFNRRAGDVLGNLKLTGYLYDRNIIPISEVAAEALPNGVAPKAYALFQNAPNPFNPATQIRYSLPQASHVKLAVYNTLGQQVALLVNGRQEAGTYGVNWDARDFASGVYYYRLQAGAFREVRKLVLLK